MSDNEVLLLSILCMIYGFIMGMIVTFGTMR